MSTAVLDAPTTVQTPVVTTELPPVNSEGCDRCGVSSTVGRSGEAKYVTQAQVRITLPGDVDGRPKLLTLCKSHANRILKSANMPKGIHVEDVSASINTAPSVSANI